jgi:hypothetical protein
VITILEIIVAFTFDNISNYKIGILIAIMLVNVIHGGVIVTTTTYYG